MSKVTPVTALASPAYQKRVATQQKIAKLKKVTASIASIDGNIASAEAVANKTYSAFNHSTKPLTASQVKASIAPLSKIHKALSLNTKTAQKNLARVIQSNAPSARCLAQLESLATLQNKVAALIIQAKASLAAEDEEFEGDLIPVDEEGYVVEAPTPADEKAPSPAPVDGEEVSEETLVEEVTEVTVPQDQEDLNTAADDEADPELTDDDASFEVPDLDLPTADLDEQVVQDLLETQEEEEHPESGRDSKSSSLRARTATKSVQGSPKKASENPEDAILASLTADLSKI